jgi:hypothetical protein
MKATEFRKLIREEVRKALQEAATTTIDPTLLSKLKTAVAARKRDPEDENAHDELESILMQIYKKMGRSDAEELASGNMEDEVTMTGPVSAVVSLIKDTVSDDASTAAWEKRSNDYFDRMAKMRRSAT